MPVPAPMRTYSEMTAQAPASLDFALPHVQSLLFYSYPCCGTSESGQGFPLNYDVPQFDPQTHASAEIPNAEIPLAASVRSSAQ